MLTLSRCFSPYTMILSCIIPINWLHPLLLSLPTGFLPLGVLVSDTLPSLGLYKFCNFLLTPPTSGLSYPSNLLPSTSPSVPDWTRSGTPYTFPKSENMTRYSSVTSLNSCPFLSYPKTLLVTPVTHLLFNFTRPFSSNHKKIQHIAESFTTSNWLVKHPEYQERH